MTYPWRSWMLEYGLPTLLVLAIGPIWIAIWGDLNLYGFALAFAVALVTGMVLRPQHAWVMPTTVVLVFLFVVYLLEALGISHPDRADLVGNLLLIPFLVVMPGLELLLCTWLGREFGRLLRLHDWRETEPGTPARPERSVPRW